MPEVVYFMRRITEYFKNAIAAASQNTIDYKNTKFFTVKYDEIQAAQLSKESIEPLNEFKNKIDNLNNENIKIYNIILALKTIATEFSDSAHINEDIEEMTSVLFMPAKVSDTGRLYMPDEGKMPWIPREFLEPMVEAEISIGTMDSYDEFFENTTDVRNQIESWTDYLMYAENLFEAVTGSEFTEDEISYNDNEIKTDGKFYIFLDTTVNATFHILELYNHILRNDTENLLYSKLTNCNTEKSKPLIKNDDISKMAEHCGQMNGEYPLSHSQREVINHFTEIQPGDILAVNGPPGTGKTTLLQSVVANMYVSSALKQKDAPIIVASSTNNQAVTNIIDSFGKIDSINIKNLEKRWITGAHSFAAYFPSKGRIPEAKKNNYQYTTMRGEFFIEHLESKENRTSSQKLFLEEYQEYFKSETLDLYDCINDIFSELNHFEYERKSILDSMREIKNIIKDEDYTSYRDNIKRNYDSITSKIKSCEKEINLNKELSEKYLNRWAEWNNYYGSIPWYIKLLKFIPYFKSKITFWMYSFFKEDELEFLTRNMSINEIECAYREQIDSIDLHIKKLKNDIQNLNIRLEAVQKKLNEIKRAFDKLKNNFAIFKLFGSDETYESALNEFNIEKLNEQIDKLRYVEFWLAVHYYECKWLIDKNPITEKQKGTTYENVLTTMYKRLSMIAPCLVMTFFMLPKQFLAYSQAEKEHYHMYDFIDLLIIDEAGQISPEIAAASFTLAKKAIVVGDEKQIPPVWNTTKALDIAMAKSKGIISNQESFKQFESTGLSCSQSSIMKAASLSCSYNKYERGLFLSEHHRCYDEIIEYCNALVYNGNLKPLRGSADNIKNKLNKILPPMGYHNITVDKSKKNGCSRENRAEANEIIQWIKANYLNLLEIYQNNSCDEINPKDILGVITPFKGQSILLRKLINRILPQYAHNIDIGTVHTFQGAEKKIIIFSTVYGNQDGCFFINHNKSLMNVAVSRAKDSFLVFGDKECLTGSPGSPAALLKKYLVREV